tara:strand:+ start:2495 stop:5677 length:3183 start_codon:yes stop_codon:yes gene_type:complete
VLQSRDQQGIGKGKSEEFLMISKKDLVLMSTRLLNSIFIAVLCCFVQINECPAEEQIDFNQQIRPLLSDRCFACHGPDEEHREGGFRLDVQESAFGHGDSEETILVPGHPEKSLLIERITSEDSSLRMPPQHAKAQLSDQQIELIRKWVAQGANWEGHWSYQPIVRPEVPAYPDKNLSPIDAFVLKRLEKENLQPSEKADRVTLLRRVTLDLTGLPPSLEEVDAFLTDESATAYEKVVDRLLNSPRFGEHQAHYWLDAARYGDTHGLHLDNYREMWPYRDWVIQAFNENMPYDQFVTEQLAGDLLENPTEDQLIATGFNRCHVTTSEGGSIAEEVYVRNVVDRVNTFGTVFLGATFDCTRCHDHKFDALTQKDYYSLFAYFNGLDGNPLDGNKKDPQPVLPVPNKEQALEKLQLDQQLAALQSQIKTLDPVLTQEQKLWEEELASKQQQPELWTVLQPASFESQGGAELKLLEDTSILASGSNPAKEQYEVIANIESGPKQAIKLEGLIDPSLTNGGAGRSSNSNVVLTGFEVFVETADQPNHWQPIKLTDAWADYEQSNGDFKITNAIDENPTTGWAIAGHEKKENRLAYFAAAAPFGTEEPYRMKVVQKYESVYAQHQFGRFRLSVGNFNPINETIPEEIRKLLAVESESRSPEQKQKIQTHFREKVTDNVDYRSINEQIADLEKKRTELQSKIPTTLVFKEKKDPKESFILIRGEYDQKGEKVHRRTPTALPEMHEEWPNDRLGLAYWLTSEENPLTARVAVNRFWQNLFGVGIVKTSEDFGSQGEQPSHPQLLNWLAADFRENGWDMKRLLRQIVLSETYQQTSQVNPELWVRDPENRLLSRGPRFRLDAEILRDQALFVSGLLVEEIGGPSVKPPQPDGLWFAVGYTRSNTAKFTADTDPEQIHRRTLYTFLKRTAPAPQLSILDSPSRESSCVRRERTNTPLQALLFFNDPQYLECAQGLAMRSLKEAGESPQATVQQMYRLCTCYPLDSTQVDFLVQGYQNDLARFQSDPEAAQKLLAETPIPGQDQFPPEELAAWTLTANLMLSLDITVNKN